MNIFSGTESRGGGKSFSINRSDWPRRLAITGGVFALCLLAGIASGTLFKKNTGDADAASASITVLDNDQVVDIDQSTGTTIIRQTSTVNIKDPAADKGYVLTAKLAQTDLAGITTTIHSTSPASIHCTETNPCPVTSDKPISVLYPVHNANATTPQGETTTLNITMTIPAGTSIGNYLLDIEYQEQPVIPIQEVDATTCTDARSIAYDARNSEIYYIQKIPNSGQGGTDLCWMETNLRYGGDGAWDSSWGYVDDRYATTAANTTASPYDDAKSLIPQATGSSYIGNSPDSNTAMTVAAYADPYTLRPTGTAAIRGSLDYTNTSPSGGFYGYLYNWCAAMGGQATACQSSANTQPDPLLSICPAGWRLPAGNDNGDYDMLNNAVNVGSTASPQGLLDGFLAVYSGVYNRGLNTQSIYGGYWSHTVYGYMYPAENAFKLYFSSMLVQPGTYGEYKYYGYAVRCVKDITPIKTLSNITYLQDLALAENASACANTPDRTRVTLKDRRNGQDYYVEKIDSLCWMESNLRYAGDGDWNVGWNYPDDRYATTASNSTATTNDNTRPLTTVSGTQSGSYTVAQIADPNGSTDYTNTTAVGGFYGYLYNWCASMGGQATACQNTAATQPDPSTSICPAGWRLPTGNTTGEFQALVNTIGATSDAAGSTNLRNQFLAVYSGVFTLGLGGQGTNSGWWSSTVGGTATAYNLYFVASNVYPANNDDKLHSFAVRCVH